MPDGGFDFFGGIADFFASILRAFQTFIVAVINFILQALAVIVAVLRAVILFLGKAFSVVFKGIRHVISDIVHGRFLHLWEDYLKLKAKLKAWFEKHLGWLLRLRQAFDQWFRRTIVPILNLLQRIRRVLAIFRVFHLKFAEKLDALLGRLESKIIRNVLVLRQKVNEISTIINLILDPSLVIRNVPLLRSIWTALDDITRIFFHTTLRRIFGPVGGAVVNPRTGLLSNEDVRGLRRAGFDTTTAYGQAGAEGFELYKAVLKEGR